MQDFERGADTVDPTTSVSIKSFSTLQSLYFRDLAQKYGGDTDEEPDPPTATRKHNMGKGSEENKQTASKKNMCAQC